MKTLILALTIVLQSKVEREPTLHTSVVHKNEFWLNNPTDRNINCSISCISYEPFRLTVSANSKEDFSLQSEDDKQAICFIDQCTVQKK